MLALEIQDFDDFVMNEKFDYPLRSRGHRESWVAQARKGFASTKRESWVANSGFELCENVVKEELEEQEPKKGTAKKPMDFDEFLPHVGDYGIYQVYLFLLTLPFLMNLAFMFMNQMFITLVPNDHWCIVPGANNTNLTDLQIKEIFIPKKGDDEFSRCTRYDVDADQFFSKRSKSGHSKTVTTPNVTSCTHGWNYNRTEVPYESIAMELNWVCDRSYFPNVAVSIYYVGAIIGGFVFGYIADHYGRITALVAANAMALIGGICTVFSVNFWTFVVFRFIVGFAYDNCYVMLYIIVLEYTGVRWRTFVSNMSIGIFFTAAMCLVPWIAIWTKEWQIFVLVTSVPMAFALLSPWIIPESARWLMSQDRIDECIKIMKRIARFNRRTVDDSVYQEFLDSNTNKSIQTATDDLVKYTVLDLFRTPRMRMITILLCIMWMTTSLVFEGHARNAGSIGSNIFIVHTIGSFTEFPADIILVLILDKVGRRWPCALALILGGVFTLVATAVPYGVYSASLAILGRATANFSYNLGVQYAAELLPTVVRGQGIAFIHIMGYVASMAAPLVVYLSNIATLLPMFVLGTAGIVGGFCCLWLPESLGCELPQTIEDGENMGVGQKFFGFPCCSSGQAHIKSPVKIVVTKAESVSSISQ